MDHFIHSRDTTMITNYVGQFPPAQAVPLPRQNGTILLVDDERDLLEIASIFLTRIGYQTLTALNAQDALRLISETPAIEVMLTDVIMPGGMNGVELARSVHKLRPSMKVIYVSGHPAVTLRRRNLCIEDHVLLNKPYRLADLSKAIRTALDTPATTLP